MSGVSSNANQSKLAKRINAKITGHITQLDSHIYNLESAYKVLELYHYGGDLVAKNRTNNYIKELFNNLDGAVENSKAFAYKLAGNITATMVNRIDLVEGKKYNLDNTLETGEKLLENLKNIPGLVIGIGNGLIVQTANAMVSYGKDIQHGKLTDKLLSSAALTALQTTKGLGEIYRNCLSDIVGIHNTFNSIVRLSEKLLSKTPGLESLKKGVKQLQNSKLVQEGIKPMAAGFTVMCEELVKPLKNMANKIENSKLAKQFNRAIDLIERAPQKYIVEPLANSKIGQDINRFISGVQVQLETTKGNIKQYMDNLVKDPQTTVQNTDKFIQNNMKAVENNIKMAGTKLKNSVVDVAKKAFKGIVNHSKTNSHKTNLIPKEEIKAIKDAGKKIKNPTITHKDRGKQLATAAAEKVNAKGRS